MTRPRTVVCALGLSLLGLWSAAAHAAEESESGRTPPRLSFYDGEVSFWRPGSEDWAPARINLPLAPGDALYTGSAANLELQIGTLAFVRAGELTQLGLSNQETDFIQFNLTTGHLAVDVRSQPAGRVIEVDTPNAAVVIDRAGYYRLRVTDDRTTIVTRRGGRATVTPANGEPRVVTGSDRATVEGNDRVAVDDAPDSDVWDRWNYDRTDEVADASNGRYVPAGVYGAESLAHYGAWRNVPTYGWVWAPTVDAGWAPYSAGSWIWDPYYGWTWVDNAPWGWGPAHYGRWVYANRYWAWAPGPVVVSPFYAPAVVAFFGGGVSVSVGFGAPVVSWVALGWGEPLYPWWGGVGFVGRPCWNGWGGPRWYGQHGHGGNTVIINNINYYQNTKVHNAILVAAHDQFGQGPVSGRRMPANEVNQLAPVRGSLPVKPVPASLAPQRGPALHPPSNAMARPVVATRPAHDPAPALQAAGLPPASAPRATSRVVAAPPQSAPRSAPVSGHSDSIDRAPVNAPRRDAPVSAPAQVPPADDRPSRSRIENNNPATGNNGAPMNAPRSAPAARVPAPPMSAPRNDDHGSVHSEPAQQMPPPRHGAYSGPQSAPRHVERVQPPAPPNPVPPMSAPQHSMPEHSVPSAPQQPSHSNRPEAAPREAPPRHYDSAPMAAPHAPASHAEMPSQAPAPAMRGPASNEPSHSAPMSAPNSPPMSAPHSVGSSPGGGGDASSAPSGSHSGAVGGGANHGGGGVGSGPRD